LRHSARRAETLLADFHQVAQRSIAAVVALLLQKKTGRRTPASCREEGHKAWRTPSAGQPHDNAARDKRGAAVLSLI